MTKKDKTKAINNVYQMTSEVVNRSLTCIPSGDLVYLSLLVRVITNTVTSLIESEDITKETATNITKALIGIM